MFRASEGGFVFVAALIPETYMDHGDGIVFLGHALDHSVRGHGRRLPEPHHPPRQYPKPPRRGAAARP